ncbi:MAG: TolC family protein [Acidobacteria bacterium]|nr:TolC family protein [Acidobacteriota bacterium]MCW5967194.1 TolC family protein [Blastocatellales bacterium]
MNIRHWNFARKAVAVMLAAACSIPAAAQTAAPQTPKSQPIPTRTVGLEPGKVIRWTLRDAVIAALEKNIDIEIERENVRIAQFDVESARGVYDLVTTSRIDLNPNKSPNAFVFSGTGDNFVQRDVLTYNFGVQRLVEQGGGNYALNFNNTRTASNVNNFNPQFNSNVNFQYTQPLFRDRKIDNNRRQIKIARKRLDLSDAQFRQRAIEIISRVQQAYWDLALAIRDEEIQREAASLAETQLQNNQRQVEVGTLAPIDVVSAATQFESRRQQVFQAMNAVAQAENALKAMTVEGPNSDFWSAQIVPIEKFDIQEVALPLPDALKLAFANRPEVKQFQLQHEINQVDLDFFKNQMKPQINLVGGYTAVGLGGNPRPGVPPNVIFPEFVGGYGTALKELFINEFRSWNVGIQFNFPLRNRTAKANYGRALETSRQLELQTRRQMQNIEVEVRNGVQAVETAKMRIEASRAAREYAEQQLDGESKKFAAGMSTTFLILTRQNELAQAQGVELRALADYNKAVAELQRVISTTLSSNNIEIRSEVK